MLGSIVNFFAIIIGGILGLLLKKGIPERISKTIIEGLALCVFFIGTSGMLKGSNVLLIIFSIVIGGIIGEVIDIDKLLNPPQPKEVGDSVCTRGYYTYAL